MSLFLCVFACGRLEALPGNEADAALPKISLEVHTEGEGSVVSAPGGIACESCGAEFPQNTEVKLWAVPTQGSAFDVWRGDCGHAATNPCVLNLDTPKSVTARFVSAHVRLEVEIVGRGRVYSESIGLDCRESCGVAVPVGTLLNLVAEADDANASIAWNNGCLGSRCEVRVDESKAVRIEFVVAEPELKIESAAHVVLGQPDFYSGEANVEGESLRSLHTPIACGVSGERFVVSDTGNARVLIWNQIPNTDFAAADVVVGQAEGTAHAVGTTASRVGAHSNRMWIDRGALWFADAYNHRLLLWDPLPARNGAAASLVFGQLDFSGRLSGTSATRFNIPTGVWASGDKMAVVDRQNHRVLLWHHRPSQGGLVPADVVLGQPDFTANEALDPPTASSLNTPVDVFFDVARERLYVTDAENNRVLIWDRWPTTNAQPADFVLGQFNFVSRSANAGGVAPNAFGISGPQQAIVLFDRLFVADYRNRRVLVWPSDISANGMPANSVVGQIDLDHVRPEATLGRDRFLTVGGLCATKSALWIIDSVANRILGFEVE